MKIVADADIPDIQKYFAHHGELVLISGRLISAADVADADMLIVRSVTKVNAELLANSSVKFVGSVTAGGDHLDTEWLDGAQITWHLASGFNAPPVCDYVTSCVAALQRKTLLGAKPRIAIIGVGHVGRLVADRFKMLGFDITLCDPIRAQQENDFNSTVLNDLTDFDLITLHVPLTQMGEYPTYHMIDREFLSRQKSGCVLLNTSRGAVIDSQALLTSGRHLIWCFDVWEHEPVLNRDILAAATIATPHIAGYSVQSKLRGIQMIYRAALTGGWITERDSTINMPNHILTSDLKEHAQTLSFAGGHHHWQDIVLGIFNPRILTAMMREKFLPRMNDEDKVMKEKFSHAELFDAMRQEFNYRHEFSATRVKVSNLSTEDAAVLTNFGVEVEVLFGD